MNYDLTNICGGVLPPISGEVEATYPLQSKGPCAWLVNRQINSKPCRIAYRYFIYLLSMWSNNSSILVQHYDRHTISVTVSEEGQRDKRDRASDQMASDSGKIAD